MAHYSLIYRADGIDPDKRIEFHGEDPSRALLLAHQETDDRPAELWKDGEQICTIRRVGDGPQYWMIGPADRASAEPRDPAVRVRSFAALNRDEARA